MPVRRECLVKQVWNYLELCIILLSTQHGSR